MAIKARETEVKDKGVKVKAHVFPFNESQCGGEIPNVDNWSVG